MSRSSASTAVAGLSRLAREAAAARQAVANTHAWRAPAQATAVGFFAKARQSGLMGTGQLPAVSPSLLSFLAARTMSRTSTSSSSSSSSSSTSNRPSDATVTPNPPTSVPAAPAAPAAPATPTAQGAFTAAALQDKIRSTIAKVSSALSHYRRGAWLLVEQAREAKEVLHRQRKLGIAPTRREAVLVKVSRDDFRKVIPFFVILLIVPETLPFLILSGANIIPSTCILPDQLTAKRVKLNKTRHSMTLATTESIQRGQVFSIDSLRSTETVRHLAAYQPQYFQLHSMSRAQLRQFSRFMGFSSWQPTFMLRSRLARHFAFVRSDDAMLSVAPGLAELSLEELQEACENRGMSCVNLDRDALAANLQAWLDLHTTTDPPIPEGLMMLWTMVHGKAAAATEPLATASDAPLPSPTSTPA